MGSFGLNDTPCIGCGGCIDICPVKGLEFQKVLGGVLG
jgi:formate hydrogenlyase subunit 6/NADH:ubiquinone oxidoreductase subunit I